MAVFHILEGRFFKNTDEMDEYFRQKREKEEQKIQKIAEIETKNDDLLPYEIIESEE